MTVTVSYSDHHMSILHLSLCLATNEQTQQSLRCPFTKTIGVDGDLAKALLSALASEINGDFFALTISNEN